MSGARIAIIGLSCRFPGAPGPDRFWRMLRDGLEGIRRFTPAELSAAGVDEALRRRAEYVPACGALDGVEDFDAGFFGVPPREAEIMDPQHRIFLELAWEALEDSGYAGERAPGRTGVYAGAGPSTYLLHNLLPSPDLGRFAAPVQILLSNNKDSMPTRVSYRLDLRGPSLNISTACSTSLVAVHVACQALLNEECDVALAGGIGIQVPQDRGYLYEPDGILSPDGHCRAFDASAAGTVSGNGGGIVVLKRLADAERDRDAIRAVILGTAINNDGALKAGYTAPGLTGQMEVVAEAMAMAEVSPDDISYIETHGTGTPVGDPIEIQALTDVFRRRTMRRQFCAIGSVKTNIGHLDEGAGVAGLIKTVLALEHREIPPSLHFTAPNPACRFETSPFFVNAERRDWETGGAPRRAGVSSFGIGGTNAHVILEEAPASDRRPPDGQPLVLPLSARSPWGLDALTRAIAARIAADPLISLADVAFTLQTGRRSFAHRRAVVCRDRADALAQLSRSGRSNALADRWVSGESVDWSAVQPREAARRVSLPTTPFERARHWIDAPGARKPSGPAPVDRWLYEPAWTASVRVSAGAPKADVIVAFVPAVARGIDALVAALRERCRELVTVTPGSQYRRVDPHSFEVRASEPADYQSVVADLLVRGAVPDVFVHLWSVTGSGSADDRSALSLGFESVFSVAQAAGAVLDSRPVRFAVVSDEAYAVESADSVRAEKTAIGGLVRTMAVEYPSWACVHVDVDLVSAATADRARDIAAELTDPASVEIAVAYRGGRRLVPEIRALTPGSETESARSLIRDGGVYLVTGGLGSMGLALAEWIASRARATLVLAARPAMEDRDPSLAEPDVRPAIGPDALALLNRFCGRLILEWLSGAGIDLRAGRQTTDAGIRQMAGVSPRYFKMFDWCLDVLEQDAVIARREGTIDGRWDGAGPTAAQLAARVREEAPGLSALVDLVTHCAARYGDVWSGRIEGTEVLYPDGTPAFLDAGFSHAAAYSADRACLDVVGRHVAALADRTAGRPLRVIEVGGGTGTLTDLVFQHLGGRAVEFTFTDVSLAFVTAAETEARRRGLRHVSFRRLDVSRSPADQAFADQAYDLVLGYNVAHATRDVRQTLRHLRGLLVRGGEVCLVETVKTRRWDQMIWGLATGWWDYDDDRVGSPLLDLDGWARVLRDAGFDRVETAPRRRDARSTSDAGVVIGRVPETAPATRSAEGRVAGIEADGSRVEIARVDVGDEAAVRELIADVRARHGRITGVIHTAAVIGRGFIRSKTLEEARRVLAPKLGGARALAAALQDDPPDLFVLCSGLASRFPVAGQADYAAANAALDGFAHEYARASGPRTRTLAIGWGFWQELGLIEKSAMPQAEQDRIAAEILENGWTTAGVEAFETVLFRCRETEVLIHPEGLPGARPATAATPSGAYPLFADRRTEQGWTVYPLVFSGERRWMLDEHQVEGHRVLPGTAYLELMRAAYADSRGTGACGIELRDVSFLRPFVAEPGRVPDAQVVVRPRADGADLFVMSRAGEHRWHLHARAEAADLDVDLRTNPIAAAFDEAPLAPEFTKRMSGFGPRWDNVRAARFMDDQAVARLSLAAPFASETGVFALHPALFDNATGYFPVERGTGPRAPFSYESVKLHGPLRGTVISRATARGERGAPDESFDVAITDESGRVLVEVTGYRFRPLAAAPAIAAAPAEERDAVLRLGTRGALDTFSLVRATRRPLMAGEVEIRVDTAGLNFIETLYALGMLPAPDADGFPFGLEGAGVVSRIGAGVTSVRPGQRVAVFANGTDRLFATAPAQCVAVLPEDLSFEDAATIPSAYMTAYTALVDQGRLQPGERVLIHSACGGVGLAAVHVSRWIGARILATAGTEEKRAYLRRMGIETVMDSRSAAFAAETRAATGGAGVDVVLNSLAGDLIDAGLSVLAPGGRFLELGKRDLLEGRPVSLAHFQERRSFIAIDVGPDLPEFDRLWRAVWERVRAGNFPPLPRQVFAATDAAAAFAEMARGRHVGKFVLSFGDREAIERQAASRPADRGRPLADILGPAVEPVAARPAVQPSVERTVIAIWEDLLGRTPIGRDENFFELNGDSLIGAQVIARIQRALGVKIPLSAIFDHPTVTELAGLIRQASGHAVPVGVAAGGTIDDEMEEGAI